MLTFCVQNNSRVILSSRVDRCFLNTDSKSNHPLTGNTTRVRMLKANAGFHAIQKVAECFSRSPMPSGFATSCTAQKTHIHSLSAKPLTGHLQRGASCKGKMQVDIKSFQAKVEEMLWTICSTEFTQSKIVGNSIALVYHDMTHGCMRNAVQLLLCTDYTKKNPDNIFFPSEKHPIFLAECQSESAGFCADILSNTRSIFQTEKEMTQ